MKLKKLIGVLALAAFAFTFTSCKKDWTCVCSKDGYSVPQGNQSYKSMTKKDAKAACDSWESSVNELAPGASCSID